MPSGSVAAQGAATLFLWIAYSSVERWQVDTRLMAVERVRR